MKLNGLIVLLLATPGLLFAQEPADRIIISPLSDSYPTECCFPADRYQVLQAEDHEEISATARDSWLAEAGLAKETAGWDHLSKDMLSMSAVGLSPEKYFAKYPKISRVKLKKLRRILIEKGIQS